MFDLHEARILLAGGSSCIGLATAELLISRGAEIVIYGRDRAKLDRLKEQLEPRASIASFDAAILRNEWLAWSRRARL